MQNKWPGLEVMTLMCQSPRNSIEFFVMGAIVTPKGH